MAQILFANNANTTLAGSISPTATTANLAAGTGVLFPAPGAGQYFVGTFTDAATGLLREIVHVTNVTGDTITMVRAQEGTTGLNWLANDLFAELWTAGQAGALLQQGDLQTQDENYAVDTGSANAYLAALTPALTAYTPGMPVRVKIANTNTGPSTLNVNGVSAAAIQLRSGAPLAGGELRAGSVCEFFWSGSVWQTDGALGVLSNVPRSIGTNTVLAAADAGRIINATAALALTTPYSATVWPGWGFAYIAAGGAITLTPAIADTIIVNGVAQTTGAAYVIPQANWGFVTTDGAGNIFLTVGSTTNLSNVAVLNVANAFTVAQGGPFGALTDAAPTAWPVNTKQVATWTITGNHTLSNPTGLSAGKTYILIITQGSGGNHVATFGTAYKWPQGVAPTLSTVAGAVDILTFVTDGTNMYGVAQYGFA